MGPLANYVTSQTLKFLRGDEREFCSSRWFLVCEGAQHRACPMSALRPASQPPSPVPTPHGQHSSASLHVHQSKNGMKLPRETIGHPLGHPRLSALDSEHHPSQNIDHLASSPPSPRHGEEGEGWGQDSSASPDVKGTSRSSSCQCCDVFIVTCSTVLRRRTKPPPNPNKRLDKALLGTSPGKGFIAKRSRCGRGVANAFIGNHLFVRGGGGDMQELYARQELALFSWGFSVLCLFIILKCHCVLFFQLENGNVISFSANTPSAASAPVAVAPAGDSQWFLPQPQQTGAVPLPL